MKNNLQDTIVQYTLIVICSAIVGLICRILIIEKGADQFTANIIFWVVVLFGVISYTILVLLGVSLFELFKKLRNKDNKNLKEEPAITNRTIISKIPDELISHDDLKTIEESIVTKNTGEDKKPNGYEIQCEELEKHNTELNVQNEIDTQINQLNTITHQQTDISEIERIRIKDKNRKEKILKEKLDFIVAYTKDKLAAHTTDEDLYRLSNLIINFLKDGTIDYNVEVNVTSLKTIDLMHFGWNIWNHCKGNNQRKDVAKFLKKTFPNNFREMEESTIEKLLSSKKDNGEIKACKDLLQYD